MFAFDFLVNFVIAEYIQLSLHILLCVYYFMFIYFKLLFLITVFVFSMMCMLFMLVESEMDSFFSLRNTVLSLFIFDKLTKLNILSFSLLFK